MSATVLDHEDWTHDELADDLQRCRMEVGELAGREVSLGSWGGFGYADVASVKPSWTTAHPTIWEVKVSRSDFLSDVRAGKYERYLPFCRRLYFAAPAGMLQTGEIPDDCGLFVRGAKGWSGVKRASIRPADPECDGQFYFALMLNLWPSPWQTPHPDRLERLAMIREGRRDAKVLGERMSEVWWRRQQIESRNARLTELLNEAGISAGGAVEWAVRKLIQQRDEARAAAGIATEQAAP